MTAKDLKNALLQEAVQGKLVPQIASEGNARDLLEEIRKEKLSHGFANSYGICGEKCKKSKSSDLRSKSPQRNAPASVVCVTKKELPKITEDEIPFEIPENWCWCRLGELVYNHGQKTPEQEFSYIDIGSIDNEHQRLNKKENIITPDKAPSRARKIVFEGDVIYSTVRPYLHNICIIDKKFSKEPIASTGFAVMASTEVLFNKYLFYYLLSPIFDNYANATDNAKGVAYPAINDDKLYKGVVPLPPLAEQKRIVSAIEKFMPLIEEYGKKETQLKAINEKIGALTKKAILQEAVQGKLVPQIASEGNARDLLEEIRKEKLSHGLDFANAKSGKKKSKKETALADSNPCDISDDEIPFDIPENWCWCRLGEIVNKLTDGTHRTPKYVEKGIPFLSVKNLSSGKMDFENTKFITPEEHKELYARCNPEKGDMLLTKVGTTGIPVINDSDIEFSLFVSVALLKFSHEYIDEKYFLYLLQSPLVQEQAQENTKGVGNKNWVMDAIAKTVLVLPPLAEQKRIVAAIEKMLPLCEKLGE